MYVGTRWLFVLWCQSASLKGCVCWQSGVSEWEKFAKWRALQLRNPKRSWPSGAGSGFLFIPGAAHTHTYTPLRCYRRARAIKSCANHSTRDRHAKRNVSCKVATTTSTSTQQPQITKACSNRPVWCSGSSCNQNCAHLLLRKIKGLFVSLVDALSMNWYIQKKSLS
jgi:hypothetical protein